MGRSNSNDLSRWDSMALLQTVAPAASTTLLLVDALEAVVLDLDGLLEQVVRPGFQVGELRHLDPAFVEGEAQHLAAVLQLDDGAVAPLRRAAAQPVELEHLLEPVAEELVERAPVDVALQHQ